MQKKKDAENTWKYEMISVLQGAIVTMAIAFGLLLVGASLIGSGKILEDKMERFVLIVCVLSTFLTGVIQKSRTGRWTLFNGILSAAVTCLFFAGIGLLVWKKISLEEGKNIVISCMCGGGISGVLFGKRRKKRRA